MKENNEQKLQYTQIHEMYSLIYLVGVGKLCQYFLLCACGMCELFCVTKKKNTSPVLS